MPSVLDRLPPMTHAELMKWYDDHPGVLYNEVKAERLAAESAASRPFTVTSRQYEMTQRNRWNVWKRGHSVSRA